MTILYHTQLGISSLKFLWVGCEQATKRGPEHTVARRAEVVHNLLRTPPQWSLHVWGSQNKLSHSGVVAWNPRQRLDRFHARPHPPPTAPTAFCTPGICGYWRFFHEQQPHPNLNPKMACATSQALRVDALESTRPQQVIEHIPRQHRVASCGQGRPRGRPARTGPRGRQVYDQSTWSAVALGDFAEHAPFA